MKRKLVALLLMPMMAFAGSDLYMVIDLSGGVSASSYPISYLSDVPDNGWSDEYKTTKLVLRRIEPGTCVVTTDKPYYVGVFEVTQKQYELITGTTLSHFSGNDKCPVECVTYDLIRGSNKGAQYPDSTDVDDDSFMGKLRVRTGLHFDLPTESQWEYACRAGTTTTYNYGDAADGDYMWYDSNSGASAHDVGTRKPNAWNLYDMHGNVWEWCLEWCPGRVGVARILRSGCWNLNATYSTTGYQNALSPSSGSYDIGFRLCCMTTERIFDVAARQRYPWNGKVDISYTVSGIEAAAKQKGWLTSLKVTAKDNDTDTTYTATSLTGDTSLVNGPHAIIWDMSAQGLTFKSTNVTFNVTCETKDALYCVVDLSAGANAKSYPVSYMSAIPGDSWSDEYKTTKLVLRRIEPGTCVVTVSEPYYVSIFEMTQKQYALIMGTAPSSDMQPATPSYDLIRGTNKGSQYPNSTEVDSDSLMGKLRSRTSLRFDLPTESQWEYACRAGTSTPYNYGSTANGAYMWYHNNAGLHAYDVGTRKPNSWGIYDMHGNVYEWCLELHPEYGRWGIRIVRGGYYDSYDDGCATAIVGMCPSSNSGSAGVRLVRNFTK